MTDEHTFFVKEALAGLDGKSVPLVAYATDGTRHVIGEATLRMDDTGLAADISVSDKQISEFLKENNI